MLSQDKVISIFCLVDDLLKAIEHPEDVRRRINDSEVITTALVSAMYFGGHHQHAIGFMKATGCIPNMLESSRFCRRVHQVGWLITELFLLLGKHLNAINCELHYILDSFPVAVCDNIRIRRCKLLRGKKWRGYCASMRRYFYGVKVQLLVTKDGIPVRFQFVPGKQADVKGLDKMLHRLSPESSVYADSAYTNYKVEDILKTEQFIWLKSQRKSNAKRIDSEELRIEKKTMRKRVETSISDIKKLFPRTIHAVTLNGFLLKLILFVFAAQLIRVV